MPWTLTKSPDYQATVQLLEDSEQNKVNDWTNMVTGQNVDPLRAAGFLGYRIGPGPLVLRPPGDEHRARGDERDQHVRVHRHVVPVAREPLEIAGELPGKVGGHVVHRFAVVAAGERRTHLAGAT